MAIRFYLVPKIGTGANDNLFRPKYIADMGVTWQGLDYGGEDAYVVAADVTGAQHSTLTANADVTAAPLDLSNTVGANLATVQAALEGFKFPGDWVTSGMTYRQILKGLLAVCFIAQRFNGLTGARLFQLGITLETTLAELTATQRQKLHDVAVSFHIDDSSATGSTTLRQVLRVLAQQLPPITLAAEGF